MRGQGETNSAENILYGRTPIRKSQSRAGTSHEDDLLFPQLDKDILQLIISNPGIEHGELHQQASYSRADVDSAIGRLKVENYIFHTVLPSGPKIIIKYQATARGQDALEK